MDNVNLLNSFVLVEAGKTTISKILHSVNSYAAHLISKDLVANRQIWSRNGWDEVIRNEDMYWQKLAYILLNPWRKGLVKEPTEIYPYSNIGFFIKEKGEAFLKELFGRYGRYGE